MSQFLPTRASPPSKAARRLGHPEARFAADISQSSTNASAAELTGLSPEDIELLDTVIKRAGPSATTFLTVFKAYDDVLRERGIDPKEVLYYGKLLKLGTMKGKNWGDKWNMVKAQCSLPDDGDQHRRPPRTNTAAPGIIATRTFHSPIANTLNFAREKQESASTLESYVPKRLERRPKTQTITSDTSDGQSPRSLLLLPVKASTAPQPQLIHRSWRAGPAERSDSEDNYAPSTTPPSYRAATNYPSHPTSQPLFRRGPPDSATAREVIANARQRRGSVINEEDAWNNIRMQRDEADADMFRTERLLERCWEVWRQGFQWIVTTNEQIGEARDNLLLRIHFQHWRNTTSRRQETYQHITTLSDNRCCRKALVIWRSRLKVKEQNKWRQDMRHKMKVITEKREQKLCKDALAKWRQSYRSHLSGQHYLEQLTHRFYGRWKKRLSTTNELELIADEAFQASQEKSLLHCWDHWRIASNLRVSERIISHRVDSRLMTDAVTTWQQQASAYRLAAEFYDLGLMKLSIKRWKASRDRLHIMENRALKHVASQDDLLLRAVSRVWKARGQGKLLERAKMLKIVQDSFSLWRQRLREHTRDNDLAVAFSLRPGSNVLISVYNKWREAYFTHRNAHMIAVQCDSEQLGYKALLAWRMRLRDNLKMAKMARMVDQFFATRRSWKAWHNVLSKRAIEKRLEEFKVRRVQRVLYTWLHRARRQKHLRLVEESLTNNASKRILRDTLTAWTNRVIAIKLQELDVAQNSDTALQTVTFKKWKNAYARRLEKFSLMQSYLLVKREENLRRVFSRWLGLARIVRHRRVTLKEKEDEIRLSVMTYTWEKWRDRFSDERLRPIEHMVLLQTQRNALFRAFGLWHSKTKSLPAIRFEAKHTKQKYFEIWRHAMPRALQAKKARDRDSRTTLSQYLDKWVQIYRKKKHLKAVARARYLRLPTAAPRQVRPTPTSTFPTSSAPFPRPPVQRPMYDKAPEPRPVVTTLFTARPFSERSPTSRFAGLRIRETSPARSKTVFTERDESPTRAAHSSDAGGNEGARNRLWFELRGVQRKSRPSSLSSRARDK